MSETLLTDDEKCEIIAEALETPGGRFDLAEAMVLPIWWDIAANAEWWEVPLVWLEHFMYLLARPFRRWWHCQSEYAMEDMREVLWKALREHPGTDPNEVLEIRLPTWKWMRFRIVWEVKAFGMRMRDEKEGLRRLRDGRPSATRLCWSSD